MAKPKPKKPSTAAKRVAKPKPSAAKKPVAKPKPKKPSTAAKRVAKPKPNTASKHGGKPKVPASAAKPRKKSSADLEQHPGYALLASTLKPGRYAGGLLLVTPFGAHDEEMAPWLMGMTEGRRTIGRTAFGDLVIFRDLRARAQELGLSGAAAACDVAMIDIHYKRMTMLADSATSFLSSLDDRAWQRAFLRAELFGEAKKRVGDYADDECFGFVPALALGGSEDAASIQRAKWRVHQDILRQT